MSDPIFQPEVQFICPFCKLTVQAGHDPTDNEPAVLHEEPTCRKFDELSIDEFLVQCRKIFQATQPS